MQTDNSNDLSCSVVGHNLYAPKKRDSIVSNLICKTCHSNITANATADFESMPSAFKNKEVNFLLRQLFLLNAKQSRLQFS